MNANRWRSVLLRALGIAGIAGLVAGGVVVARGERARRAMTPDQVRDRLHERYARIQRGERPESAE